MCLHSLADCIAASAGLVEGGPVEESEDVTDLNNETASRVPGRVGRPRVWWQLKWDATKTLRCKKYVGLLWMFIRDKWHCFLSILEKQWPRYLPRLLSIVGLKKSIRDTTLQQWNSLHKVSMQCKALKEANSSIAQYARFVWTSPMNSAYTHLQHPSLGNCLSQIGGIIKQFEPFTKEDASIP